ncbi:nuclear pore complex protein Nup50 [Drosophila sulfurigaster albostrigata]|uniref:nuclear pore complex protein Nup50 n=1 Tax=Drosophila sulfurigaster albostrigata TaxID=89887 RepID=UPI002D21D81E|nr:nuclear pore complex protein Nup50 [Drosophila sulfurigaster albostrigata]
MAGKRQATTNLNHDNWDQEDEPEERGTFRTAPPEELKTRVIKKATRRKVDAGGLDGDGDEATPKASNSVFSGFSGFGKPAASLVTGAGSSPFAFLSNLAGKDAAAKPSAPSTDKADAKWTTPSTKMFAFDANKKSETSKDLPPAPASSSIFGNASACEPGKSMFKSSVPADKSSSGNAPPISNQYRDDVIGLNMAVMKFLQEHLDKTPCCILTPVFDSYNTFLKEVQQDNNVSNTTTPLTSISVGATPTASFSFGKPSTTIAPAIAPLAKKPSCTVTSGGTTTTSTASTSSFSFSAKPDAISTAPASATFSFGLKPSTTATNSDSSSKPGFFSFGNKESTTSDAPPATSPPKTNGFSFGLKSSDDKPALGGFAGFGKPAGESAASSGFSFTSPSTTFSFGNVKPPTAAAIEAAEAANAEDEEDTPPKVEFNKVVEDDATFSKRCKVFVKKDKDFADRGVGTLYLKPVKDSDKTQMLVRADTNLGNILINLILSKGLPCQRMGKNNVMMVCVPTPEESKAMSILLRVKTSDEADELLEQIKTHSI